MAAGQQKRLQSTSGARRRAGRWLAAAASAASLLLAVPWPAAARVAPSPIDAALLQTDPALYAIARSYFPTDDYRIAPKRVFRLTRDQLDVTVRALLPGYVKRSIKTSMPRDPLQTNYEYAEILSFNAANLAPLTTWIGEIASSVRERPQGVIDCPPATASGPCHVEAATRFIARAFRGDIDQARQQRIVEFYAAGITKVGFAQATADLVEVTLSSPGFLFRKELDVDGASGLTPVQRLQALTYTLADAPPESLKLTSAKATEYFASPQSTAETVKVVLAHPETRQKLVRFVRAWLEIKEPSEFTISKKLFPEFNDALAEAMVAEANRFLTAVLGSERPRLRDLTQARQSFPSNALEAIYATKIGSPDGSQPTLLDPRQRLRGFLPASRPRLPFRPDRHQADQARYILGAQGHVHGNGCRSPRSRHLAKGHRPVHRTPPDRELDAAPSLRRLPQVDRPPGLLPGALRPAGSMAHDRQWLPRRRQHEAAGPR